MREHPPTYEVFAIKYAERAGRFVRASDASHYCGHMVQGRCFPLVLKRYPPVSALRALCYNSPPPRP